MTATTALFDRNSTAGVSGLNTSRVRKAPRGSERGDTAVSSAIILVKVYEISEDEDKTVSVPQDTSILRLAIERTGRRLVDLSLLQALDALRQIDYFRKVEEAVSVESIGDEISFIQASLGLSISQLADVLEVQRQTIYNWINESDPTKPQGKKSERLAQIKEVAIQWNQLSRRPAGKLSASLKVDGSTLIELLQQPNLNDSAIKKTLAELAKSIEANVKQRHNRIRTGATPPDTSDDRILRNANAIPFYKSED